MTGLVPPAQNSFWDIRVQSRCPVCKEYHDLIQSQPRALHEKLIETGGGIYHRVVCFNCNHEYDTFIQNLLALEHEI